MVPDMVRVAGREEDRDRAISREMRDIGFMLVPSRRPVVVWEVGKDVFAFAAWIFLVVGGHAGHDVRVARHVDSRRLHTPLLLSEECHFSFRQEMCKDRCPQSVLPAVWQRSVQIGARSVDEKVFAVHYRDRWSGPKWRRSRRSSAS